MESMELGAAYTGLGLGLFGLGCLFETDEDCEVTEYETSYRGRR